MALLGALWNVILPVVIVAGVGAVMGSRFTLDSGTVGRIALHALTPAIALDTLLTTQVSSGLGARIVVAYAIATVVAVVLGLVAAPGMAASARRAVMVSASSVNSGNMGLPISLFALGQAGLDQTVLMFLTSTVLMFVIVPMIMGSEEGLRAAAVKMARLPVLWAVLVAAVLRLVGFTPPLGVMRGIELLSDACLPMALFALGMQLAASGRVRLSRPVVTGSLLRIVVLPAVSLGIGLLCGLHGTALQALVLAQAMPVAVNGYLLTMEYGGDVDSVAHSVTLTTLAGFVTIAGITAALPLMAGL
ncbi:AEC family transporter [Mariniluteicoccus endophyticus]